MNGCPSCQYPVDSEWTTCRRCGARLPVLEIAPVKVPPSMQHHARPAPPKVIPGPPPSTADTLLPHGTPGANAPAPRPERGADTLLPRTRLPSRATAQKAGLAAASIGLGFHMVRRLRRH